MLLDSGVSHSFVSSSFVAAASLQNVPTTSKPVKLPNGQLLTSNQMVPKLEWLCQGYTLTVDMRVLDLSTYDAILGFDWLETHSPMKVHWQQKWMIIPYQNSSIMLYSSLSDLPEGSLLQICSLLHGVGVGRVGAGTLAASTSSGARRPVVT